MKRSPPERRANRMRHKFSDTMAIAVCRVEIHIRRCALSEYNRRSIRERQRRIRTFEVI